MVQKLLGAIVHAALGASIWYMSTEIGARNFGDVQRYNLLPVIAKRLGLNTRSKLSLWQDRALIELNRAVLHSFTTCGVTIVNHHTASTQFMQHWQREAEAGRSVPADWGRIVPPISGSTMEVFHQEMHDVCLKPNFFQQLPPWKTWDSEQLVSNSSPLDSSQPKQCPFH